MNTTSIPPFGPVTQPEPLPDSIVNVTPGDFLRQELAALGLNQSELATRTNLSAKHINQVLKNVAPLSTDTALRIERATGLSANLLITLQARRDAQDGRNQARAHLGGYRDWFNEFPRGELVSLGIVNEKDSVEDQIDSLLHFFGVADPDAYEDLFADSLVSFRRAQHLTVDAYATAVWLRLGELKAEEAIREGDVPSFSKKAFLELLDTLPSLTKLSQPQGFELLAQNCRSVGLIVVYLPEVLGSRANAVTRWVANRPVMILTDRGKFEDTIWFNFFHEAAHVVLHPKRRSAVNLGNGGDDSEGHESEANAFARRYLLRHRDESILRSVNTVAAAILVADQLDIDPGIVAGQAAFTYKDRFPKLQKARKSYRFPQAS